MAWFKMKDGSKKFLTPSAAARRRQDIRRRLPGGPTYSEPRHHKVDLQPTETKQDEEE